VPFINQIADRLADEMAGNGVAREAVFGEECPFLFGVIGFGEGTIRFKMVAPTGEFHAVVAHFFGERKEFREGKVSPLSGEKCNWSWHSVALISENFPQSCSNALFVLVDSIVTSFRSML
jgi:hypothetical protein